jgi:hypothetical protein
MSNDEEKVQDDDMTVAIAAGVMTGINVTH